MLLLLLLLLLLSLVLTSLNKGATYTAEQPWAALPAAQAIISASHTGGIDVGQLVAAGSAWQLPAGEPAAGVRLERVFVSCGVRVLAGGALQADGCFLAAVRVDGTGGAVHIRIPAVTS